MIRLESTFDKYDLTEKEYDLSFDYTTLQLVQLRNIRTDAAEEKVTLKYDSLNPMAFVQREAELQGQIGVLTVLINSCMEIQEKKLRTAIAEAQSQQSQS